MNDVLVLALVLLLVSSGYAAGRVHGQVGYRDGYRSGYRQGYADGTRSRPRGPSVQDPPARVGVEAATELRVTGSDDLEPSESRHLGPLVRAAVQRVRHTKG